MTDLPFLDASPHHVSNRCSAEIVGVDASVFFSLALSGFLNCADLFIFLNKAAKSRVDTRRLPPDPLIKSLINGTPEQNINKKPQLFQGPLSFSSTMEGVCSAQVQAQNKHTGLKTGCGYTAPNLIKQV
jgi:hypothetical protein